MRFPRPVSALLAVTILVAMGSVLYVLTGPMHHEIGCPFMPAAEAICNAPVEHLSHWQSSFSAIVWDVLLLFGAAVFFIAFNFNPVVLEHERIRYKTRAYFFRPSLYEELFSKGILNRKEPAPFAV
jgi:hypothetical protein